MYSPGVPQSNNIKKNPAKLSDFSYQRKMGGGTKSLVASDNLPSFRKTVFSNPHFYHLPHRLKIFLIQVKRAKHIEKNK